MVVEKVSAKLLALSSNLDKFSFIPEWLSSNELYNFVKSVCKL